MAQRVIEKGSPESIRINFNDDRISLHPLIMSAPDSLDPSSDPVAYLRSIKAVRERNSIVLQKAQSNQLNHFEVDLSKFHYAANYVVSIIKVSTLTQSHALMQQYSVEASSMYQVFRVL